MIKVRNKHKFILDKIPYILFAFILIIAVIILFSVRSCMPLTFFSGMPEKTGNEVEYSLFIASPSNNQTFNFVNQNETIPIEIKAKEGEILDYTIKVLINENEIKSFTLPPYEYNWNPGSSGKYEIIAQLVNNDGDIVMNSDTVNFTVQYEIEPEDKTIVSMDIEEKKNKIISQSTFRTNNTIPTGVPILSYKCYTPPIIDGVIQEWDKFESFSSFVPTIRKENYTSHTDISGTFYSSWDDDNFYFAVNVIDDVFNQNYTGNQINKGDSLTIVFDTELEEDMQIQFYNSDDYQIDFSPGNFAGIPAESFMNWPTNASPRSAVIDSTRTANGYILEASVPWYNFTNYIPADEDVLGFTVSLLDTDNMDTTELVISSSTIFDFNNVSTLGSIALIDVGDIQNIEEETSGDVENHD